jgi:hypothetical protein
MQLHGGMREHVIGRPGVCSKRLKSFLACREMQWFALRDWLVQ